MVISTIINICLLSRNFIIQRSLKQHCNLMAHLQRYLILSICLLAVFCFRIPSLPNWKSSSQSLSSYSVNVSKKYASYSAIAFCPKTCIETWTCGTTSMYPKLVNITYIESSLTKAAGYIGYDPNTKSIVISWRGSNNIQNWIQDFNFQTEIYTKGGCKDCKIHSGFYGDYKLNQKILLARAQVEKILCTGHSLGAAISLITGIQLSQHFTQIPVEVHNFGCPRIGNVNLAHFASTKIPTIFRVVHNKDIVPHLPPQLLQYHHPAYEVFFNEDLSSYKICDQSGEDKTCSNQFAPKFDPNDHDHYFVYISQTKC